MLVPLVLELCVVVAHQVSLCGVLADLLTDLVDLLLIQLIAALVLNTLTHTAQHMAQHKAQQPSSTGSCAGQVVTGIPPFCLPSRPIASAMNLLAMPAEMPKRSNFQYLVAMQPPVEVVHLRIVVCVWQPSTRAPKEQLGAAQHDPHLQAAGATTGLSNLGCRVIHPSVSDAGREQPLQQHIQPLLQPA